MVGFVIRSWVTQLDRNCCKSRRADQPPSKSSGWDPRARTTRPTGRRYTHLEIFLWGLSARSRLSNNARLLGNSFFFSLPAINAPPSETFPRLQPSQLLLRPAKSDLLLPRLLILVSFSPFFRREKRRLAHNRSVCGIFQLLWKIFARDAESFYEIRRTISSLWSNLCRCSSCPTGDPLLLSRLIYLFYCLWKYL